MPLPEATLSADATPVPHSGPDEPGPDEPGFDEFCAALRDHARRAELGVFVSDADARLLLGHPSWAVTFYRQWLGDDVRLERGAPLAVPRAESRPIAPAPPPVVAHVPAGPPPARPSRRRMAAVSGALLAAAAGVVALALATGLPPGALTGDSAAGPAGQAAGVAAEGELPTLALPDDGAAADGAAGGTAADRLVAGVADALALDPDVTGTVPGLDDAVRGQLLRTADLACLQGVDDAMAAQIAASVAGTGDVGAAEAARVADAIREYCAT